MNNYYTCSYRVCKCDWSNMREEEKSENTCLSEFLSKGGDGHLTDMALHLIYLTCNLFFNTR